MEWLYVVALIYLIGAVLISWQCEKNIAEDQEYRTALIIWSSLIWPVGLVVYYTSPKFKKFREEAVAEEEKLKQEEEARAKLKKKAEMGYRSAVSDMVGRLRAQRDQLVKNLEECGDDEVGRAVLKASIEKTNDMLAKYDPPKEVA